MCYVYKKVIIKMINQYLTKMLSYFNDALIINYKAYNYYHPNPISGEDLSMFYDLLVSNNSPLAGNINRLNYIACDLYYQSLRVPEARKTFYSYFEKRIKMTDPVTDQNLFFIYNIIEFEDKFHICPKEELFNLLNYLNKFTELQKTFEHFLLFKYYKAVLHYFMGDYSNCNFEYMDIVSYIAECKKKNNLINYIELRNSILGLRKAKDDPSSVGSNEYGAQSTIVFQDLKAKNKILSIKIGINIYEIYNKNYQYYNCLDLLKELQGLLKEEMFEGLSVENGIDYYLAIASRVAFCSTIINDKKRLSKAMKKIEKSIDFLDTSVKKYEIYKIAFEFILLLYKFNLGTITRAEKTNEIIGNFKRIFLMKNPGPFEYGWLFKDYPAININLFAINNLDMAIQDVFTFIDSLSLKIQSKSDFLLQQSEILPFVFGVFNIISGYSQSLLSDPNIAKQTQYRGKIQNYAEIVLNYITTKYIMIPLFQMPYVKNAILKLLFVYLNTFFSTGNYELVESKLALYDEKIKKSLEVNEKEDEGYGYILKLKGDLAFKKGKYQEAVDLYESIGTSFGEENEKNKAVVMFNKGISYLFLKNKRKCIDCLNLCVNLLNMIAKSGINNPLSKYNLNSYLEEKMRIADEVLKKITE